MDLDKDYDAVLLSGVICINSRNACGKLFDRAYARKIACSFNALIKNCQAVIQEDNLIFYEIVKISWK